MKSVIFVIIGLVLMIAAPKSSWSEVISISAVGDIMMGTDYPADYLPPGDGEGIFDAAASELAGSDVVFGNLEGPLTDGGRPSKCGKPSENCFEFRTPARFAKHLKQAGFNALSIANNHASDFGAEGIEDTIAVLRREGIEPLGGDIVARILVKGRSIAIAGFSFSDSGYSYPVTDVKAAERIIRALKHSNDIVIVSFHGGAEGKSAARIPGRNEIFLGEKRGNVKRFARACVNAGADMVLGHGPHVLRAIEVYKGKLIAYSLGNFLTYGRFNISGPNGITVVLKAMVDADTGDFMGGTLLPYKLIGEGIPVADFEKAAVKMVSDLTIADIKRPNVAISTDGELNVSRNPVRVVFSVPTK
jgi:hypothetical protein